MSPEFDQPEAHEEYTESTPLTRPVVSKLISGEALDPEDFEQIRDYSVVLADLVSIEHIKMGADYPMDHLATDLLNDQMDVYGRIIEATLKATYGALSAVDDYDVWYLINAIGKSGTDLPIESKIILLAKPKSERSAAAYYTLVQPLVKKLKLLFPQKYDGLIETHYHFLTPAHRSEVDKFLGIVE